MARPLTRSTGREEYGRSVERSPCFRVQMTDPTGPLATQVTAGPIITSGRFEPASFSTRTGAADGGRLAGADWGLPVGTTDLVFSSPGLFTLP
jgi:hypothetical protein